MAERTVGRVVVIVGVSALLAACGVLGEGHGSGGALSITYEVNYADHTDGQADISYADATGETVTKRVETPWESEPIEVEAGRSYHVSASTQPREWSSFVCGIRTNRARRSIISKYGGECAYTFPEDSQIIYD